MINMERFERELDYAVSLLEDKTLKDMAHYALYPGGKRLRPTLVLETAKLFGDYEEAALPFAVAVELIHNYSLIHDDLPAMDDDEYRRGKKTLHIVYGEGNAILAGDALFTLAFEYVLARGIGPSTLRGLDILAQASGGRGMVGGQVRDIAGNIKTYEDLIEIYRKKTGALIRASVLMGAVAAGASEDALKILYSFSDALGLAFQLRDDLLDLDDEDLNALMFLSQEEMKEEVEKYTSKALAELDKLHNYATEELRHITEKLLTRTV